MAPAPAADSTAEELGGFAVAVVRDEGGWSVTELSSEALSSLDRAEREIREMRSAGATFGLLNVEDEFFVIIRPTPSGSRVLLSDATAALEFDLAEDALDQLNIDVPDIDPDDDVDPWEEGDLAVLADLGLDDAVLSIIVAEVDLYADEQISMIAQRMGFLDELGAMVELPNI